MMKVKIPRTRLRALLEAPFRSHRAATAFTIDTCHWKPSVDQWQSSMEPVLECDVDDYPYDD